MPDPDRVFRSDSESSKIFEDLDFLEEDDDAEGNENNE
tara:strand:+ start:1606 stop:1719 length:114 start_codon:yes stop_codon:yes gene_type:complete